MHQQLSFILTELRSAWRFRWAAMGAAWVLCALGWAVVSAMPDIYEARARFYVDSTSQLRRILGTQIIQPDVASQLNFVRETMLGRAQLEHVARETGLSMDARTQSDLDRIVEKLRSDIQLSIGAGQQGRDFVYTIRYESPNRTQALDVVQTVLNAFVEFALGTRQQDSETARRFIEEQVREYEERLAITEQRLADFKREHADVLPGREGGYFQRLQTETTALEDAQAALALAESRRQRMQEQLRGERPLSAVNESGQPVPGSLEARIRDHERSLEDLLLRYTGRHPDVVALRESLERLREQLEEEQRIALEAERAGGSFSAAGNPVYEALQISLNEVEVEIASLSVDVQRRRARVEQLRSLMAEVPEVEAQLARLDRDYDVVNAQYQALLRSLETERLTREASESEQVEFRIIDPPVSPTVPVAPPRVLMLAAVFFAGLGGGGGLAFLLAQLRPVFSNPVALREATGLPVLGAVSSAWKDRSKARRRVALVTYTFSGLALFAVFLGVVFVEVVGPGWRALIA